jgi:hypothetical protein
VPNKAAAQEKSPIWAETRACPRSNSAVCTEFPAKQRDILSGHQRIQRRLALVRRLDAGEPHLAAIGERQRPAVDNAFDLSLGERLAGADGVVGRPRRHRVQQGKPAGG